MIDVFGRAEHFQIESGPALAPEVNRVPLVEVDTPRHRLRLPTQPVELQCELGVRARRVVGAKALHRRRVAVCDADDARLPRLQINLESYLVVLAVAVEVVGLRRQFGCLQRARVLFEHARVRGRNYAVAGTEVGRDALQFGDADDDVLALARVVGRVRHRELQDLHARRGPSGVRSRRQQQAQRKQFEEVTRPQHSRRSFHSLVSLSNGPSTKAAFIG